MTRWVRTAAAVLVLGLASSAAWAQTASPSPGGSKMEHMDEAIALIAACLGCGLIVWAGGKSISTIGSHAVDAVARQPEAAASMFLAWLLTAAMIEGAMLFGLVICYMAMGTLKTF